ncbi:hypothetical protein K469DRAFT_709623, partial [Zopfia rhizophila CBS 207.26]
MPAGAAAALCRAYGVGQRPPARRAPTIPKGLYSTNPGLPIRTRLNIYRFLLLGWSHQLIADREDVSLSEVYYIDGNLRKYGSTRRPSSGARLGRPPKLSEEDKRALFDELFCSGWMYQDEIVYWL